MQTYFVGSKKKPKFLIEIINKTIKVYTPDKYSKNEEFFEKYSLGELLLDTKYENILFTKDVVPFKHYKYTPEIIVKIKNKYIILSETITEIKKM
jgi:hypothetical protein